MTDSNGGELDAWGIMNMMDSGHAEEVVAVLSGVAEEEKAEERGFFEVVFTADELGLPAGGCVELEILGGGADFRGTAFAGADGRVRFARVPRQDVGATVSIALTVYDSEGHPVCSGNQSAVVEAGGTTEFKMPMVDLPAVPLVTFGSNGSKSGFSATKDGESYEVYEYTGSGLDVSIVNQDPSLTMEVDLDGSHSEGDVSGHPLADGFHEITATVTKDSSLPPVTVTKRVYAVKALTEDDISFMPSDYSTAAPEGEYEVLRFSYLADTIVYPNLSVNNEYTGDSTTTEIGASSLSISMTGKTTVAQTSSLTNKTFALGDSTVTVTLSKPLCTPVTVTKNYRIKIKPVTVSLSSIKLDYDDIETNKWVQQIGYIQGSNTDGTDSDEKKVYVLWGDQFSAPRTLSLPFNSVNYGNPSNPDCPAASTSASAVLTAPDSSFSFWTSDGCCTYDHPGVGHTPFGHYDKRTWTLDDLKIPANRSDNKLVGSSQSASRYIFTLTVTDD